MNWRFLKKVEFWTFTVTLIALLGGLVFTLVSWLKICSNGCSAVHHFQFYEFPFEWVGFIFFPIVFITHLLSRSLPLFGNVTALALAGGVGAEVNFIGVQKFVVGQWCPICLTIAFCVGLAALVYLIDGIKQWSVDKKLNQGANMWSQRAIATASVMLAGFVISFFGVFRPEKSFADGLASGDPGFGKKGSSIEVYVVTDWFCPGCSKMDVHMKKDWPEIMKHAQVFFIDYPIHTETKNFIPYHLSFMVHNKGKYLSIREVLHRLADKTKRPKMKDIQNAVKPLSVTYQPLDFEDIDSGVRFFNGIVQSFEVQATPTVVIANRKTLQSKKLEGTYSITKEAILNAIKDIENSKEQANSDSAAAIPSQAKPG